MAEHSDRAFFQAFALTLVTKVLGDIRYWAEQPHPEPLPKDWDCTYRRKLSDVIEQAVANFAGDSETVARLRITERLARDVVSAMSSSFDVSSKPAVEWPEAYAAYFQKMLSEELFLRGLRDSLDTKDRRETKRRRRPASDTRTAAAADAGRIGQNELQDRNGVPGGGTSVLIQEPRDSGTRNMNSELNGIDGINTWLQQWWKRAGDIVVNYDDSTPEDPWAWQGWLAAGFLRLPGTIGGESVAPLIEFLQGIIALWEPSETQGPKPTKSELLKLSSRAWVTYNRLQVMIGKIQEGADVVTGGETTNGATEFLDSDYAEERNKSEWAAMLGLEETKALPRAIKEGRYRVYPGTKNTAKKIRIHIDDLPKDLKSRKQRNDKDNELKQTGNRQ